MKRRLAAMIAGAVAVSLLAGCGGGPKASAPVSPVHGGGYKDGTYKARSGPDDAGGVGEITLTIANGKITKAAFRGIQVTGQEKDAEYGKTIGNLNKDFYNKAQNAVKAMAVYPVNLVETQDVEKVDAISGATISHSQFVEAVRKALLLAK